MATITKKDLIDRIAERTQSKHGTVRAVVQQFLDEMISEIAKGNWRKAPKRRPGGAPKWGPPGL